jgi:hypothetical protein
MLRRCAIAVVTAAVILSAAAAAAQPDKAAPRFSFAEQVISARNDALEALLPLDPWGVRRILDALAAAKEQPAERKPLPGPGRHRDVFGGHPLPEGMPAPDPARNPDLSLLFQRSSPEAAYDLFQILKRVGGQIAN